jgi:hypothetical protein
MRRITVMSDDNRMTLGWRRTQAARDQVRVAYGEVPAILEGLPAEAPFRTAIRERARSLLVAWGCLTTEEIRTLTVKDAMTTALRRCHDEIGRTDRGRAPRPGSRATGVASRAD